MNSGSDSGTSVSPMAPLTYLRTLQDKQLEVNIEKPPDIPIGICFSYQLKAQDTLVPSFSTKLNSRVFNTHIFSKVCVRCEGWNTRDNTKTHTY